MIFPIMFEDVDFNASEQARGVKLAISGLNWTMCRPGVDDYSNAVSKLMRGMREEGSYCQMQPWIVAITLLVGKNSVQNQTERAWEILPHNPQHAHTACHHAPLSAAKSCTRPMLHSKWEKCQQTATPSIPLETMIPKPAE